MIWKILSILSLIVPLAAIFLGLICWRYPPQGPNWLLGFRSRRARAGDESWRFAQQWAGKLWFLLGLVLLFVSLLVCGGQADASVEANVKSCFILIVVQAVCLALSALGLEGVLLYRFDRFGRPKPPKEQRAAERKVRKAQRAQRRQEAFWGDDDQEEYAQESLPDDVLDEPWQYGDPEAYDDEMAYGDQWEETE